MPHQANKIPDNDAQGSHSSRARSRSPSTALASNTAANTADVPLLMTTDLLPLLLCQCCSPPAILKAPTTLHCGHTVCSIHVTSPPLPGPSSSTPILPTCPLPSCRPSTSQNTNPTIPSSSKVAYFPAPPSSTLRPNEVIKVPDPKLDVVVAKVMALVARPVTRADHDDFVRTRDEDHDLSEDQDRSTSRTSSPSPSRPRKRRRHLPQSPTLSHSPRPPSIPDADTLSARFEKDLMAELTCEICYMCLYQPVTTPCQHTFCAKCLQRSLDHSTTCPLCRQDLPGYAYFQDHPYNQVLLAIILKAFPLTYEERGRSIEEEERDARLDTPIFVCQLSFPGMPTLLHFFEPRYRLMLRRCLSSPTPRFGMIMPPRSAPSGQGVGQQTDYGTMLEIRSVQMLMDGRSMVETWGVWRFRILERGLVDGYLVGRVERIDDYAEELDDTDSIDLHSLPPSSQLSSALLPPTASSSSSSTQILPRLRRPPSPTNEELMATCHGFLDQLRHGTAPWVVQRLNNTYGPMPTSASEFSFWMALVLPIDEHDKAKLLPIRSARLRLRLVVHWIEQLNSNWAWGLDLWFGVSIEEKEGEVEMGY